MKQAITIVFLLGFSAVSAGEIYSWTAADGSTVFSDKPPASESVTTQTLELLPAPQAGDSSDSDYYSVANQAARMQASRMERERLRMEQERLRLEQELAAEMASRSERAVTPDTEPRPAYYPVPAYRNGHYMYRPGPRHNPYNRYRPPAGPPRPAEPPPRHNTRVFVDRF